MTRSTPKHRPTRDTTTPGEVWEMYENIPRQHIGYYISVRGDKDEPIAYCPFAYAKGLIPKSSALRLARQIARDPSIADKSPKCVDLRRDRDGGAQCPVHGWLFSIWVEPMEGDDREKRSGKPSPLCPYRFAQWAAKLAGQYAGVPQLELLTRDVGHYMTRYVQPK